MREKLKNQRGLTRGGLIILLFIIVVAIVILVKSFSNEPKTEKIENKVAGYSNVEYKEIVHDNNMTVEAETEAEGDFVNANQEIETIDFGNMKEKQKKEE